MTLVLDEQGNLSLTDTIAQLEEVIKGKYKPLQAKLAEIREVGYYEGRLNYKQEELQDIARDVIFLFNSILIERRDEQAKADADAMAAIEAIVPATDSLSAIAWVHHKKLNPEAIVFVPYRVNGAYQAYYEAQSINYVTYAQDTYTLKRSGILAMAIDSKLSKEAVIPQVLIPADAIKHHTDYLRDQGVEAIVKTTLDIAIPMQNEKEIAATAEVMRDINPEGAIDPLYAWHVSKRKNPSAIVLVQDTDPRCLTTYAGDALMLARLLHISLCETWFMRGPSDEVAIAKVQVGKGSAKPIDLRLKERGIKLITVEFTHPSN